MQGNAAAYDAAQNATPEEISLETLSEDAVKKIMTAYKAGRDVADHYYTATVEPALIRRYDVYRADVDHYSGKFPRLSELSSWVSRDVKTTIDWIMPSLMEVFVGSDDPVDIAGVNVNDDDNAKKIQQLLSYFVTRKNSFFTFMYNFLRDGLTINMGCAKVYWKRDEERQPMEVLADAQMMQMILAGEAAGQVEIKEAVPVTPLGDLLRVTFDLVNVKVNQPVIENMSPSELRFTPEARDLHQSKFVAQRKVVRGDYLKRMEAQGVYQNVDEAMEKAGEGIRKTPLLDKKHNERMDEMHGRLSDGDNASKEFELYEAYLKVDFNNDGIYENVIVHAVGDTPLKIQDNVFEMPPFFIFSPEHDAYAIFGEDSITDTLEQLQDLKTALIRQMIIAVAKNNVPQKFVDENNVDMDALLEGAEIVPVKNNIPANQAVFQPPPIQIDGSAMTLVQYAQNEIESQSGSTRYNQGLDSSSLNRTATGISAIMGASDKKIKLIARLAAETAWIPIVKFLILLCQKFVDDGQMIRLADENIAIRREEISIDYDLIVNVGRGASSKEIQIQYLMVLINQLYPKLEMIGIVNAESWYNVTKELLEVMGIRSTEKYLLDPNGDVFRQQQAQAQQVQQAAMEKQDALTQAELQIKQDDVKAKTLARLSAQFKDLPMDAQISALQQLGLSTSPAAMAEKIARDERLAKSHEKAYQAWREGMGSGWNTATR
nr:MAG TPA: Portal protein [Caudoviricetes sp.]